MPRRWMTAAAVIGWVLAWVGGPAVWAGTAGAAPTVKRPYCIVDTGQARIFSSTGQLFRVPKAGEAFFGQDGFYQGVQPQYRDNGDGTSAT